MIIGPNSLSYVLIFSLYGCHVDTHAAVLRGADGGKLTLEMDGKPFAFSAVPYTPRQLEQAAHVKVVATVS
mgnify:CR=1 FL=1